ncbi:hypothetical protein GCM10022285_14180 [Streptomyces tunisiensis]|uniref:Uncharacterized protein n=1 Tax=Streptomyces tunisiensis TaxID=948699 RepID=A0ABP7XYL6_9ACTN
MGVDPRAGREPLRPRRAVGRSWSGPVRSVPVRGRPACGPGPPELAGAALPRRSHRPARSVERVQPVPLTFAAAFRAATWTGSQTGENGGA